ncbi:MAG: type II toxin-antitoxin system VapC family toxin [Gallionella sp.]|nr:type II toxin-antitoxin system VapC family toxin [Gallionella sp.]
MIYLDTSFVAPLFRDEPSSRKVADFVSRQAAGGLVISKWTSVEFASMVSRGVRMGGLSTDAGRSLIEVFDTTIAASFVVLVPNSYDFDLAQEYVTHFATQLRAPDALHLAVSHNNGVEFVATLDEGMLAAAKKLKIPARRVIR